MKISRRSMVVALCLFGVFALGLFARDLLAGGTAKLIPSTLAQGGNGPGARKCSARTLKGTYGIKFEGKKLAGDKPLVSISRITFDGEGTFTTTEIGRFGGEPLRREFTGPYTVNDDCTGFLDFSSGLTDPAHEARGDFIIVDGGKEFFVVDNEEGWAASGVGKRL